MSQGWGRKINVEMWVAGARARYWAVSGWRAAGPKNGFLIFMSTLLGGLLIAITSNVLGTMLFSVDPQHTGAWDKLMPFVITLPLIGGSVAVAWMVVGMTRRFGAKAHKKEQLETQVAERRAWAWAKKEAAEIGDAIKTENQTAIKAPRPMPKRI